MKGYGYSLLTCTILDAVAQQHIPDARESCGLRAIGGHSFGEAMCKPYHAGRAIGWIEQHIHNMQTAGVGQGDSESALELSLRGDPRADSTSDHVANSFIVPLVDIVEGAFEDLPF